MVGPICIRPTRLALASAAIIAASLLAAAGAPPSCDLAAAQVFAAEAAAGRRTRSGVEAQADSLLAGLGTEEEEGGCTAGLRAADVDAVFDALELRSMRSSVHARAVRAAPCTAARSHCATCRQHLRDTAADLCLSPLEGMLPAMKAAMMVHDDGHESHAG
eukprot:SAG22_NODE_3324_length_1778_cov_1.742108_1_plen_161_part_00